MRPDVVFFDLDDTLVDETGLMADCVRRVAQQMQDVYPFLPPELVVETYLRASLDLWRRVTPAQAGVTIPLMRRWTWEDTLRRLRVDGPVEPFLERYTALRDGQVRPFPDARPVLEELRRRGYRTGVISNGETALQRWKLDRTGLSELLDPVVTSQEVGRSKPDPEVFFEAARRAGADPHRCWMVGDLPHADVAGAVAAGMTAVWVRRRPPDSPPQGPRPHHTVDGLSGLLELLP
ncbi:MAG: HAD family hydrolase [Armatimonadota bacterium]|nr:HAD family hydrolase [Armatimonadota bacterium]MDW8155688.1 HAD family hydrolase [Armatimonadota bacterium]